MQCLCVRAPAERGGCPTGRSVALTAQPCRVSSPSIASKWLPTSGRRSRRNRDDCQSVSSSPEHTPLGPQGGPSRRCGARSAGGCCARRGAGARGGDGQQSHHHGARGGCRLGRHEQHRAAIHRELLPDQCQRLVERVCDGARPAFGHPGEFQRAGREWNVLHHWSELQDHLQLHSHCNLYFQLHCRRPRGSGDCDSGAHLPQHPAGPPVRAAHCLAWQHEWGQ